MTFEKRPLGRISIIADELGFPVSYAYDDLVFLRHNVFLLQFDDTQNRSFNFYSNTECEADKLDGLKSKLETISESHSFVPKYRGMFSLQQTEGSTEMEIRFLQSQP
jgi:hypothetical protein